MANSGEGNGTQLQYSCLENPMDGGAWKAAVHVVAEGRTRLSDFTFTFHFHALEKEMSTHSSVLAWRIPGMGEPGGLPSMGSHRVGHYWSDLAALYLECYIKKGSEVVSSSVWNNIVTDKCCLAWDCEGEVKHVPQLFVIYQLVLALYQTRERGGQGLSVSFMSQHSIRCVLEDSKCLLNEWVHKWADSLNEY